MSSGVVELVTPAVDCLTAKRFHAVGRGFIGSNHPADFLQAGRDEFRSFLLPTLLFVQI